MADDSLEETNEELPDIPKTGIKKLLANKKLLIAIAVVLLLIIAGATYFLVFASNDSEAETADVATDMTTEDELGAPSEEGTIEIDIAPPEDKQVLDEDVISDKSRIERISDIVKENSIGFKQEAKPSETSSNQSNAQDERLLKQIELLKEQNAELKGYIKGLDNQTSSNKPDTSVPIDKMLSELPESPETEIKPIQDNPYMYLDDYDSSQNYYSSPYADDEQVPEPLWGE